MLGWYCLVVCVTVGDLIIDLIFATILAISLSIRFNKFVEGDFVSALELAYASCAGIVIIIILLVLLLIVDIDSRDARSYSERHDFD